MKTTTMRVEKACKKGLLLHAKKISNLKSLTDAQALRIILNYLGGR